MFALAEAPRAANSRSALTTFQQSILVCPAMTLVRGVPRAVALFIDLSKRSQ